MFGPYFDRVAARATGESNLVEVRRARREFQELTGRFEEDEPWFEQRMTLFLEWFVFDRPGRDGLTPIERFLTDAGQELLAEEREIFTELQATQRTLFRLERWHHGRIELRDMLGGGSWSVHQSEPMVGLQRDDLMDARVVPFSGDLHLGHGLIFHPRVAREAIMVALEEAHQKGGLCFELINLLATQRLRFDRYRNVKVRYIYKLPDDWRP